MQAKHENSTDRNETAIKTSKESPSFHLEITSKYGFLYHGNFLYLNSSKNTILLENVRVYRFSGSTNENTNDVKTNQNVYQKLKLVEIALLECESIVLRLDRCFGRGKTRAMFSHPGLQRLLSQSKYQQLDTEVDHNVLLKQDITQETHYSFANLASSDTSRQSFSSGYLDSSVPCSFSKDKALQFGSKRTTAKYLPRQNYFRESDTLTVPQWYQRGGYQQNAQNNGKQWQEKSDRAMELICQMTANFEQDCLRKSPSASSFNEISESFFDKISYASSY